MSALDDGSIGLEVVTDLGEIARGREYLLNSLGYRLPLQDAERAAGLTEADIWRFTEQTTG
jgi:hypothetical protein